MSVSGEKRALWGLTDVVVIALALVPVLWIVSLSLKTPATLTDTAELPGTWVNPASEPLLSKVTLPSTATVCAVRL